MPELSELVRDAVTHQADRYEPAGDLPQRITRRVRRRVVERRVMAAAAVVAMLMATGGAVRLFVPGGVEDGNVETFDPPAPRVATTERPPSTSSTTAPAGSVPATAPPTTGPGAPSVPSTTTTSSTEPSTTTTSAPEPGTPITAATPLNRSGIGDVVAGMTLAEAQEATGMTFTLHEPIGPGATCRTAGVDGTDIWFLLHQPGGDPLGAVIQSVQGGSATAEGVAVGDTLDDLRATYGEPTEVRPYVGNLEVDDPDRVYVFQSGGFAYSASVRADSSVFELESGLPEGVGNYEGCA